MWQMNCYRQYDDVNVVVDDDDNDDDDHNDDHEDDDDHCHVFLGNKVPEIDRIFPESAQLNERWYMRRHPSLPL